jgi:hypothetical protein
LAERLIDIIDEFDKLGPAERIIWANGSDNRERYLRQTLHSYISKNNDGNVAGSLLTQLATIYERLFGDPFSPTDRTKNAGYRDGQPRFGGRSVLFACAVIEELRVARLMIPYEPDDLPNLNSRSTEEYDLKELNRAFAFSHADVASARLANRIGDLWHQTKKNKRAKRSSSLR